MLRLSVRTIFCYCSHSCSNYLYFYSIFIISTPASASRWLVFFYSFFYFFFSTFSLHLFLLSFFLSYLFYPFFLVILLLFYLFFLFVSLSLYFLIFPVSYLLYSYPYLLSSLFVSKSILFSIFLPQDFQHIKNVINKFQQERKKNNAKKEKIL